MPEKRHVFHLLRNHSSQYDDFGREFGIELDIRIEITTRAQSNHKILELFIDKWIEGSTTSPVTWEFLVQTVLIYGMELRTLAREVMDFLDHKDIQDAYYGAQDWKPIK